jgi:hypothetical protein
VVSFLSKYVVQNYREAVSLPYLERKLLVEVVASISDLRIQDHFTPKGILTDRPTDRPTDQPTNQPTDPSTNKLL